jgi:hypothetical protein
MKIIVTIYYPLFWIILILKLSHAVISTPMRCILIRYTLMRHTPVRCTPMRRTPMRCTPMKAFARA